MSELKKEKKKTWTAFSTYIRTRDCLKTTGTLEEGVCISCGRRMPFKKLQAGHLVAGRCNAILFDEEIVNSQCYACNVLLGGNGAEYYRAMLKTHSEEHLDELMARKYKTVKFTVDDLKEMRETFKQKTEDLIAEYSYN